MNDEPICPCGPPPHPRPIDNPPGRDAIAYRVGDFASFRAALLQARPGEAELSRDGRPIWRPGPDDLALQLAEWWAYLADILTFSNERAMRQAFLRTADRPESLRRLIAPLGYRPRPAIAAAGLLAAELAGPRPVALPQGLRIQSKPGPGQAPQVFELDADTVVNPPDAVPADPPAAGALLAADAAGVRLRGTVTSLKPGDRLLLLKRGWDGVQDDRHYAWVEVAATTPLTDPRGRPQTLVTFSGPVALPAEAAGLARAQDYRLLRSGQSAQPWKGKNATPGVLAATTAHLAGVVRDLHAGDPVLFDASAVVPDPFAELNLDLLDAHGPLIFGSTPRAAAPGGGGVGSTGPVIASPGDAELDFAVPMTTLVRASRIDEAIWYANPAHANQPGTQPEEPTIPIPILHTVLTFGPALGGGNWNSARSQVEVRFGWREVGELVPEPATRFDGRPGPVVAEPPATFPAGPSRRVIVAGADGRGVLARAAPAGDRVDLSELPDPPEPLAAPVRVWMNLLPVSRGQTVAREVLGRGDARLLGQEFVLQKSPLTYLPVPDPETGRGFTSTLRLRVDGVEWREVASFYGQPPAARVFVTSEDDAAKTHVRIGDGTNGARLATGAEVVASYRVGGGAAVPPAGALTVLLDPRPGLRKVHNPVPVGGGSDPDPPDQIRRDAPRSVLTLGRAVSVDDYEAIASRAPGVTRARASWAFDPASQRSAAVVYVGDDDAAVASVQVALDAACDPNRPARVRKAVAVPVTLRLDLRRDPARSEDGVLVGVRAALLDPETGLFGRQAARIGQPLYDSQLAAACFAVPGVRGVQVLEFSIVGTPQPVRRLVPPVPRPARGLPPCAGHRHEPGEGRFFQLDDDHLELHAEADHVV
jgi:hypothetical protein